VALVASSAKALQRRGVVYIPLKQRRAAQRDELAALWRSGDRSAVREAFVSDVARAARASGR
jgi:hypothetical protein